MKKNDLHEEARNIKLFRKTGSSLLAQLQLFSRNYLYF